jgi:hypothetical protein
MSTLKSTFTTELSGLDGRLARPYNRLHYLDLAVGPDDDALVYFLSVSRIRVHSLLI